ncbi:polysaccharide pyruvyl transferase family protein [Massilibacterium senegalense]|uniref:polysaccharide pyruvyl transferase family protein n=1 Tax=Massilibacterium senegalense TaxID=1632858 RepID=UPI00078386F6|nr:polysaccharide pyruvyl transferase family protein [Massilibacterium senegalense]
MKKLNVLHLASFHGNIGDNANHNGVRNLLKKNLDFELVYTDLEIRRHYWGEWDFDDTFIEKVNQFDLLIIGGGNYFELWVEKSKTGTTIDLSPEQLAKINIPILFNGLGCDPNKGYTSETLTKFKKFLDYTLHSEKCLVSVRNDGSLDNIKDLIGLEYANKIYEIPDGGFFYNLIKSDFGQNLIGDGMNIAINLAGDMLERRFSGEVTYKEFIRKFSLYLESLFQDMPSLNIIFIPHIFRDLSIIFDVLENINDKYRRTNISVAPCIQGDDKFHHIFDIYSRCNLVLGTRFHSNVCNIALGIPTIGLVCYPNVKNLYKSLGLEDRIVDLKDNNFDHVLRIITNDTINNFNKIKEDYDNKKQHLLENANEFHCLVNEWLKKFY